MSLDQSESDELEQHVTAPKTDEDHLEDGPRENVDDSATVSSAQAVEDSTAASGNALKLAWTFGFQKDLISGVHSLSAGTRRAVFYAAAHTGVIYDYARRQQRLLQGHCHPISCCVVSEDKRWVVTADRGQESMLVVWDAQSGNPIRTIFRPHANGVQAIDLSPDALFLVTLSAVDRDDEEIIKSKTTARKRFDQELAVWEWAAPVSGAAVSKPLYSSLVATEDVQHAVRFNTYDVRELVTTGRQRVIFWSWAARTLLFYSPSLAQKDFRQVVGAFTQSLFVPDSAQALTGTEDGDLVLWDAVQTDTDAETPAGSFPERKAVKIVRLAGGAEPLDKVALTILVDMDGYLVLGSSDGAVRFYDFDFRLVAWFEDMNAGPVTSVSFALPTGATNAENDHHANGTHQGDDTDGESFHVPDFIVSTASAFIVGMSASLFGEHEPDRRRGTLLMQGINDSIHGLATHPRLPQLALSSYSGVVQLWDYSAKRLIMVRRFDSEKLRPQCLTFARDGRKLVVGFTSGIVKVLHAHRLDDLASFRLGKAAITDVLVSPDSSLFVALDANLFLGMWRAKQVSAHPDGSDDTDEWVYLGRCRAHSKPVTGLEFSRDGDGQPVLVSVSEDRTLAEYCLERSSILDGVVLKQAPTRVELSAVPTACCWHPELRGVQEDLVIVANDEYKLKQWNTGNQTCRKTTLGPSYGGPINRLVPVPLREDDQIAAEATGGVAERYCVYSTYEKVVGLLKLPLDGNPHKAMGLIAHPGKISNVDVTFDGSHLLTAGGDDLVVNMWEIHPHQLDLLEARGTPQSIDEEVESDDKAVKDELDEDNVALAPYLALLEGGREGSFYHEIVDYFYLAQLRVQGEDSTTAREITAQIPLREIPNVMRALGFYPTDEEIQHMVSEVRYSRFTETSRPVESIGLHDFIKLYVNHRPVFGVGKAQIERAFKILALANKGPGDDEDEGPATLRWDQIEARLLNSGEPMSEEELRSCLAALLATGDESGGMAMDPLYTALSFADKVLGFDDYEQPEGSEEGSAV
ncbi:Cilia- and flagella-associated protein [Phytophthora cactorum]|uniref:Cilia- and flagella-associated protein 251 n=1 Tax=Phytophthora cactorum TaxID=29920 RepID=A0A329SQH0_9STRA|nr:Cilia- and flagella-associated protein [Phytophthora cactorum]KAG2825634.1 Cilia- and flagella-associated protein [Phytophthora cactorum]KAG2834858.1 Cilia- and flagella-associated protein [Phytophthora cactorum]KAG2858315.1 Cilia- and flagella-associated protein [Phytophthora cactorum]KAG2915386.1 Cilia- and flagella-associated protein [Phytophthora cactorum]